VKFRPRESAGDSENGAPDQGADEVREKKEPDIHPRNAGGDRNQSANARQKLSKGYLEETVSGEAFRRAVEIFSAQQHPFAIALDPLSETILTECVASIVKREGADDGSDGTGDDHAEERHLIARRPESGERHYQL